ncbi:MAG: hypothetical protein ACHQ9S_21355 [Candidatus Binatia bacterium]
MTEQNITLAIAILGAVTGTTAFAVQMLEWWKYRARVSVRLLGVYRMPVDGRGSQKVVAVVDFQNKGRDRITILGTPDLILKTSTGKVCGSFRLEPLRWDESLDVALDPLEVKQVPYDGRRIEKEIADGRLPDVETSPGNVRFILVGKSTAGRFSAECVGFEQLDDRTVAALRIMGNIGENREQGAAEVRPPTAGGRP